MPGTSKKKLNQPTLEKWKSLPAFLYSIDGIYSIVYTKEEKTIKSLKLYFATYKLIDELKLKSK